MSDNIINVKCEKCGLQLTLSDESFKRILESGVIVLKEDKFYMNCPNVGCDHPIELRMKGT